MLSLFGACPDNVKSLPPTMVSEIDGKEMVLIPAGEFIMGTDKIDMENTHQKIGTVKPLYMGQHPKRKIRLPAFYIDRYEVTNLEYQAFLKATSYTQIFPMRKGQTLWLFYLPFIPIIRKLV